MPKQISSSAATLLLGYNLKYNVRDHPNPRIGKKHKYGVSTLNGNGPVLYFDSLEALNKWIEDVNEIRGMQNNGITLLDFMRN
jgi:hypothetical protein